MSNQMRSIRIVFLAAALFSTACSDVSAPPKPGALIPISGDEATAPAGTTKSVSLRVMDSRGKPMPNIPVGWEIATGGGRVSPATVQTNASGEARAEWTLGTVPGQNSLTASVEGIPPLTFTVTAEPAAPAKITLQSEVPATAVVGATISPALAVLVRDRFDNPVPGIPVRFAVTAGGGTLAGGTQVTNAQGIATLETWTLGTVAGTNTVSASVEGLPPVAFSATATPAEPAKIMPRGQTPAADIIGANIDPAPSVVVRDRFDNPVPGISVRFVITAGEGTLAGAAQTTNAQGVATLERWTLGSVPGQNRLTAQAEALPAVDFAVEALPFNLSIDAVHLNQGSQTFAGSIGAVSGRPGLLRVVVRASKPNRHAPVVRVRLFQGSTLLREERIQAPATGVPTAPDLSGLVQTWNLPLSAADVVPGLAVEATVDPDANIPDTDRADNRFPRGSGLASLNTLSVPPLRIIFFPIHSATQGLTGSITSANVGTFLEAVQQWIPSSTILTTVRSPFTTTRNLTTPDGWSDLLSDLQAVRTVEGARDEYYHGIIADFPGVPHGGKGYMPTVASSPYRSGVSYDRHPYSPQTIAHELGHNFGRGHAPCGNPDYLDLRYPHPNAGIGSPGYDLLSGKLVPTSTVSDFMSYCWPRWTSDYTYDAILQWRRADPLAHWQMSRTAAAPERETDGLLLWGRIGAGQVMLNPAFALVARPALPDEGGPNELKGIAGDGSVVFRITFLGTLTEDGDGQEERHFSYFIPLSRADMQRIERLELVTPRGTTVQTATAAAAEATHPVARVAARPGNRMRVEWDANVFPMLMIRDPGTGHVLAIGRGGQVELAAETRASTPLEVIASDGVRSRIVGARE
jgi:hypothetical protein